MTCPRCLADPQPHGFGSPRNCAFKDGTFTHDNWNCASLTELREVVRYQSDIDRGYYEKQAGNVRETDRYPLEVWNHDDHLAVLPIPEDVLDDAVSFVVLLYYKGRGRTSCAYVMSEAGTNRPLALDDIEAIAKYLRQRKRVST